MLVCNQGSKNMRLLTYILVIISVLQNIKMCIICLINASQCLNLDLCYAFH